MSQHFGGGAVTALFEDYDELAEQLAHDPSGLTALSRTYPKSLLMAAASSLEDQTKKLLPELFRRHGRDELATFVERQVAARGFHTLFNWKDRSAASFFVLFGADCKTRFRNLLSIDEGFRAGHIGFMELGATRNETVHGDYASVPMSLTTGEIRSHYRNALTFVANIEGLVIRE